MESITIVWVQPPYLTPDVGMKKPDDQEKITQCSKNGSSNSTGLRSKKTPKAKIIAVLKMEDWYGSHD